MLFGRENSQLQNTFFSIVTTMSCAFLSAMNKSLHAIKSTWSSRNWLVFHTAVTTAETHLPPPHCAHIHWLVSINVQQVSMNVSGCHFCLQGRIQFHTFASSALRCQTPLCQSAPLLPSVTQQRRVMGYWWEGSASTAIPPTSNSDVMGQHHKIRGITAAAALVYYIVSYFCYLVMFWCF